MNAIHDDAVHLAGIAHGMLRTATMLDNRMKDLAGIYGFRADDPIMRGIRGDEPTSYFLDRAKGDLSEIAGKLHIHLDRADQASERVLDMLYQVARRAYAAGCEAPELNHSKSQDEVEAIVKDVQATWRPR